MVKKMNRQNVALGGAAAAVLLAGPAAAPVLVPAMGAMVAVAPAAAANVLLGPAVAAAALAAAAVHRLGAPPAPPAVPVVKLSSDIDQMLSKTFCGWYYHGFAGGVQQAVTAGAFTKRISEIVKNDAVLVHVGTNGAPVSHMYSVISDGRFDKAQSLELNKSRGLVSERMIPLLVPFTVQVIGPTASSSPVECIVAGVCSKSAMFHIIECKVTSRLLALLQVYEEERIMQQNQFSRQIMSTKLPIHAFASVVSPSHFDALLTLDSFINAYEKKKLGPGANCRFAASLGSVMLMASIQHNADIDAGDRFRDKRGRQAALDEYEAALKNALFH